MDIAQQMRDLEFKINTTPRWMGRFIYERMLRKLLDEQSEYRHDLTRLNLCYDHMQERHQSHYSPHNCHHCQLQEKMAILEDKLAREMKNGN